MFQAVLLPVFVVIGFFLSAFLFWRKGREEHYDEGMIFDAFLLSALVGFVSSRAAFIALHFSQFGVFILRWLDSIHYPGFNITAGLVAATFYLYRRAQSNRWDTFEVLDFWVMSVSFGLSLFHLGTFFAGIGYGYQTNWYWGVVFPNLLEPHHPVQLYFAFLYFCLSFFLSKVEYSYRTFEWYRYGKKTAQTGFLTAFFLIFSACFSLAMSFFHLPVLVWDNLSFDRLLAGFFLVVGLGLLYVRSGRPVPQFGHQTQKPSRISLEALKERK